MSPLDELRTQFNGHIAFKEKRPGILQVFAPLFHEDGDMIDMFLDLPANGGKSVRISDHGLTVMRLSYSYELDTPNKLRIFHRIFSENRIQEQNGSLYLDTDWNSLYPAILQFGQTVAKVSNMQLFKREVIQSMFYELLDEFIEKKLGRYNPRPNVLPIPERDDLEVAFAFDIAPRPIYLFGVKDNSQARLVTISCLEFQKRLRFKSVVVHEEFENLSRKDRTRITNAADKQFTTLDDFRNKGEDFFDREAAA
jgi:Domain of unknown function DUF1828